MKRLLSRCALLLPCLLVLAGVQPERPEELHVIVLHTNDVHGQVLPLPATWLKDQSPLPNSGGLARVAAYVNEVRAQAARDGQVVLVVDAGDWFQGTPEGRLDHGLGFLKALAAVGYDAMCVGNHEFDHGVEVFEEHLAAQPLPALLANAREPSGQLLAGTQAYKIIERGGLRIALVGLLSVQTPEMSHPSTRALEWTEPADALRDLREELADQVDWFLPLTHIGINMDKELARAHPDLPLVVGGHSHTFLGKGTREGRTLVVQSGSKCRGIGRVDLVFDKDTKRVLRSEATVVNPLVDPAPEHVNEEVQQRCAALLAESAAAMDAVVGRFAGPLERGRSPYHSGPSGNLITDVMRARGKADVAIHNRGGIRDDIDAGEVTRRDLFRVLPFDNSLVTVVLNGAQIEALMRRSIEGGARSGLEFSGMTIDLTRGDKNPIMGTIRIGGEALVADKRYRVTTNNFLANGGDAYREFGHAKVRETDPILQRDLLEEALREGPLTPPVENRYVVR